MQQGKYDDEHGNAYGTSLKAPGGAWTYQTRENLGDLKSGYDQGFNAVVNGRINKVVGSINSVLAAAQQSPSTTSVPQVPPTTSVPQSPPTMCPPPQQQNQLIEPGAAATAVAGEVLGLPSVNAPNTSSGDNGVSFGLGRSAPTMANALAWSNVC